MGAGRKATYQARLQIKHFTRLPEEILETEDPETRIRNALATTSQATKNQNAWSSERTRKARIQRQMSKPKKKAKQSVLNDGKQKPKYKKPPSTAIIQLERAGPAVGQTGPAPGWHFQLYTQYAPLFFAFTRADVVPMHAGQNGSIFLSRKKNNEFIYDSAVIIKYTPCCRI